MSASVSRYVSLSASAFVSVSMSLSVCVSLSPVRSLPLSLSLSNVFLTFLIPCVHTCARACLCMGILVCVCVYCVSVRLCRSVVRTCRSMRVRTQVRVSAVERASSSLHETGAVEMSHQTGIPCIPTVRCMAAALLALALDALVRADARPQALLALTPAAVMLADLRSPTFPALAADALVLADAAAQALLAPAPDAVMLAYAQSPAFLARALLALMPDPGTPCTCSFDDYARISATLCVLCTVRRWARM